jgi:uncharacterized repeat protein (TIGR03899 family)
MADNKVALLDIGQISEPVSKLIEAVRAAVGTVYEPTRIRRKAAAEADAALIIAKAELKIQGLERRAAERVISRELRRQENIERITQCAIEELPETVADEKVDPDWVIQFFDNCQDISNEEMHTIWARLLAGEVAQPGSFSPRTLAIFKLMRREDAELFERACSFVWNRDDDLVPVLLEPREPFVSQDTPHLDFGELIHLESMGMLSSIGVGEVNLTSVTEMVYFGKRYGFSAVRPGGVPIGKALFTQAGQELARIVKAHPNWNYRDRVLHYWRQQGVMANER